MASHFWVLPFFVSNCLFIWNMVLEELFLFRKLGAFYVSESLHANESTNSDEVIVTPTHFSSLFGHGSE